MPGYFPYDVQTPPPRVGFVDEQVVTRLGTVHVVRPEEEVVCALFLHGVSLDWTSWTPLLEAAAAAGTPAPPWLMLDLPGFGGSDPLAAGLSLDDLCDALVEVLDALGLSSVDVVGHSMGGFAALHLASRHPDRVRSLATLNGAYATVVDLVNEPLTTFRRSPRTWLAYRAIRVVGEGGPAVQSVVRFGARTGVLRFGLAGLAAHPRRVPRSLSHALVAGSRPASFRYAQETGRGYDCRAVWSAITVPVLAGYGAGDLLVTARDARTLRDAVPALHEVVLPDSSHLSPLERPDEWYAELTRFWGGLADRR